jgi:ribonuclease HII
LKVPTKNNVNLYQYEEQLEDLGIKYIAGVDEVGRGPLAGPVVVAAVILPLNLRIKGINDSKKLSLKKRNELYKIILNEALAVNVSFIDERVIDEINIYEATKKGMLEAISGLKIKPEHVLIDAMPLRELAIAHTSIIHGDALSASIGAASIIAKVTRDEYMDKMDIKYPNYGFKHHKGYCTKEHLEALEKYGPCEIHRKSFAPVKKFYTKQLTLDLFEEDSN